MANYNIPIDYVDKRGVERVGYKPFFADEFANSPNSSFRFAGDNNPYFNVKKELLNQFEKTGQIIGGETDDAFTYFARGTTSAGDYLPINLDKNNQVGRNVLYEVNSRFNPNKSNLYSVIQGFTDNEIYNTNQILKPNKDASWLQRVNPFERRGIKLTTFDTTESFNDASKRGTPSLRYSKPLNESVYYDRTKPFYQTSLTQNLKNLGVEAKILGKTPLPPAFVPSLGAAGGVLSMGMQAYGATRDNMYDREYGYSDPYGTRPTWDFMTSISGLTSGENTNMSPAEAWRQMGNLVKNPEWQMRNPYTAPIYNLLHGNTEPAKAFVEGYKPFFTKPVNQRYDISPPK